MRYLRFGKKQEKIPLIGQGTAAIDSNARPEELEMWKRVLKKGIELGMTHIDTAELYGKGKAEELVGDVVKDYNREELFITTKILPSHRTKKSMMAAMESSLNRLGLEFVDLYLIHWLEEDSSLKEIITFLESMVEEGKARYIGVSNFSLDEVKAAKKILKNQDIITNQIELNVKKNLHMQECLPYYQDNNMFLTAYSPFAGNGLAQIGTRTEENLNELAQKYNASLYQIALAWLINHDKVITIPMTKDVDHVIENAKAASLTLTKEELKQFEVKMINGY
ncbi:MAG: aldo/keto reductase [Candidatus Lokiarchaeota archaeon]|nr:aldo/keto reductase [Candidatus Lokiarchaeota archaeon]MBD3341091.1 aldo/keto reductase [Candidatus Lokiarchaeota archaeon]